MLADGTALGAGESGESAVAVADVLAVSAEQRVALEVQWSRQSDADLAARQRRYRELGVRGVWFTRHRGERVATRDLPRFQLAVGEQGPVVVQGVRQTSVERFAACLLRGDVRFVPALVAGPEVEVTIQLILSACQCCGHRVLVKPDVDVGPVVAWCGRELVRPGAWSLPDRALARVWREAQEAAKPALEAEGATDVLEALPHPPGRPFLSLIDGGGFCPKCYEGRVYRHTGVHVFRTTHLVSPPAIARTEPHWCLGTERGSCAGASQAGA